MVPDELSCVVASWYPNLLTLFSYNFPNHSNECWCREPKWIFFFNLVWRNFFCQDCAEEIFLFRSWPSYLLRYRTHYGIRSSFFSSTETKSQQVLDMCMKCWRKNLPHLLESPRTLLLNNLVLKIPISLLIFFIARYRKSTYLIVIGLKNLFTFMLNCEQNMSCVQRSPLQPYRIEIIDVYI